MLPAVAELSTRVQSRRAKPENNANKTESIFSPLPPFRLRRFGQTLRPQHGAEMQLGNFRPLIQRLADQFVKQAEASDVAQAPSGAAFL